jgi:hypothetical protein
MLVVPVPPVADAAKAAELMPRSIAAGFLNRQKVADKLLK